jgi:hypothetical protein
MKQRMGERDGTHANRTAITSLQVMVKALAGGPSTQRTYPTPRTPSETGGGIGLDGGQRARAMDGYQPELGSAGQLNPAWVEWLMGWPIGFTALEPLATDRFQRWLRLHGCSSEGR